MVGLIILGIILVFLAVLVIRALLFIPKPQPTLDAQPIDFDKDAAVSSLQKLVQCKTISNVDPSLEDDAEFQKLIPAWGVFRDLPCFLPAVQLREGLYQKTVHASMGILGFSVCDLLLQLPEI